MIIDVTKISEKGIDINQIVSFDESYLKSTSISKLDNVSVVGRVYYDITRQVILDVNVKGIMVLLDAIDLEPIDYPFDININEVLDENNEEIEKNNVNNQNILDIMTILWQNIVLEVPIRIVKDENRNNAMQGDGWELIDENTKKVDPRLEILNDLIKSEGKE